MVIFYATNATSFTNLISEKILYGLTNYFNLHILTPTQQNHYPKIILTSISLVNKPLSWKGIEYYYRRKFAYIMLIKQFARRSKYHKKAYNNKKETPFLNFQQVQLEHKSDSINPNAD